jgi:mannose-6-phosphate isomerase
MLPIVLSANRPADRAYLGGGRISLFRGDPDQGPYTPEDWIGSTTSVRGHATLGQTVLPGGVLLAQEIASKPVEWLGARHIAAFGIDTKLLVKLLDAGQRLPMHAHPHRDFAEAHLGTIHGKAEAWYILTPGEVYLGFTRDVGIEELQALINAQKIDEMLALMHRVPVVAHQTVYVPPGLLHATGEGILLAEVQEPEDLSILLEWRDFEVDGQLHGHLGLGFDLALQAVEIRGRSADEIAGLVSGADEFGSVLVAESQEYFRLERVSVSGEVSTQAGFAIGIVINGDLQLLAEDGSTVALGAGSTAIIPFSAGPIVLRGSGTVLLVRPPVAS